MIYYLLAALIIRLLGLNASAIWFDEAISQYRASLPLASYLTDMSDYVGMNLWENLLRPFAIGPAWLLRIPALAAAVIALYCAWRIMDHLGFTRSQRFAAALPLLILPGLIWQAQDARYYAAIGTVYMLGILFALQRRWLGMIACMGLLPYVHPIGPAYSLGVLIVAWIAWRLAFKKVVLFGAVAFVAMIPRLVQIWIMRSWGLPFWYHVTDLDYIAQQTAQAFAVNTLPPILALILLAVVLYVLLIGTLRVGDWRIALLMAAVLTPIAVILAGTVIQPLYFYRPIGPIVLPFCLLAGMILFPARPWPRIFPAAIAALLLAVMVANWDPAKRGGAIDQGAAVILDHWHAGDQITYASLTVAMPFQRYTQGVNACLMPDNGMDKLPPALQALDYCGADALRPGTWLVVPWDPMLDDNLAATIRAATVAELPAWRSDIAWQFAPIEIYYLR